MELCTRLNDTSRRITASVSSLSLARMIRSPTLRIPLTLLILTHQALAVAEIDCRRTDRTHPLFLSDVPPEEQGAHPPSNAHVMAMHDILMTWVFAPSRSASGTPPGTAAAAAEAGEPVTPAPAPRNYVQGMSDLFSPLYVVLEGEQWLCYALFENQMERHADNFLVDQSGMARQLAELQSLLRVMDRGLYHHFGESGTACCEQSE